MELKIPSKKAIEILEKRKAEINGVSFEPKVWKGKTENDLREIFDGFDTKWLQISQITFDTPYSEMKYEIREKGKKQAIQYIESYIEQIEEYTAIKVNAKEEDERYFENENKSLKKQISEAVSSSNYILEDRNGILSELNEKNKQVENLKQNTVQLSEITINKLFGLLKNLPLGQVVALFGSFFAIIAFAFYFGTLIQGKSNMDSEFELRNKLDNSETQNQELKTKVSKLEKEKTELNFNISEMKKSSIKPK
jgi:hypothetical protein